MMVSERGTMGEFNIGQSTGGAHDAPGAGCLLIENHTMTRLDEAEFIWTAASPRRWRPCAPVCFILSPLLTGGKVFAK